MTAGRASGLALALVGVIMAFAALWSIHRLTPAFQRAYRINSNPVTDHLTEGKFTEAAGPLRGEDLSPAFSPSVLAWSDEILLWAGQFELDPNLVATIMQIESCGDPRAHSPAGAMGLFQVMPYHFLAREDSFDPNVNAHRGLQYLKEALILSSGDVTLALAGYNGGHGQIERQAAAWPAETRRYVYWGSGILRDLESNASHSPTLTEWMQAGGASLCRRASETLLTQE